MKMERIEICIASLSARAQRIFSAAATRAPGLGVTIDDAALKKNTLLHERAG